MENDYGSPEMTKVRRDLDKESLDRAIAQQQDKLSKVSAGIPADTRAALKGVAAATQKAARTQSALEATMDLEALLHEVGVPALDSLSAFEDELFTPQEASHGD